MFCQPRPTLFPVALLAKCSKLPPRGPHALFDNSFKRQIIGVRSAGPATAAKSHNMQSSSLYFPIWVDLWGAIDARKHLSRQFMKLDMSLPPAAGGRAIQLTPDHNIYLLPPPLWDKSGASFQDLWQLTGQVKWGCVKNCRHWGIDNLLKIHPRDLQTRRPVSGGVKNTTSGVYWWVCDECGRMTTPLEIL